MFSYSHETFAISLQSPSFWGYNNEPKHTHTHTLFLESIQYISHPQQMDKGSTCIRYIKLLLKINQGKGNLLYLLIYSDVGN